MTKYASPNQTRKHLDFRTPTTAVNYPSLAHAKSEGAPSERSPKALVHRRYSWYTKGYSSVKLIETKTPHEGSKTLRPLLGPMPSEGLPTCGAALA